MKKKIFNNHTGADLEILNGNDKEVELLTNDIKSKKEYFQTGICQIKNKAIYYGEEEIIKLNDIAVRGMHNYENIMAAIMVVKQFNVSNEAIVDVLKTFPGVEHRLEYVTTIDDVKYYNDAKEIGRAHV